MLKYENSCLGNFYIQWKIKKLKKLLSVKSESIK